MRELIATPFEFTSTADDVLKGVDLGGKRAIITGGASGIGFETARALAKAGADVTLAVRDAVAGEKAATAIGSVAGRSVHASRPELVDRVSIDEFVANWSGPLHILVNNAHGNSALIENRVSC